MSQLTDKLVDLIKSQVPMQIIWGKVSAVDKSKHCCDVEPLNGNAEMFEVQLKALIDSKKTGMVLFPVVGSIVLVGLINNDVNSAFVAMCNEVESIIINGGEFGGLVKAKVLKTELDKTNAVLKTIVDTFSTWVPVQSDGGAALKTAMNSALAGKVLGNYGSIENEKVKH